MLLSAIVLTRNEERNIERCLRSLQWVDEIIVVDSGSTDDTPLIATLMRARVISHPWEGAGAQYAFAISQVRGKWVLIVDADEEVTPDLAEAIREEISRESFYKGYYLLRKNYALGRWLRYGGWQEWVLRLFRRDSVESPSALHPRFQVKGRVSRISSPLKHYMALDLLDWWFRSFQLARSEAEKDYLSGKSFNGWLLLLAFWKFLRRFIFRLGFLDGWAGFFACFQRFLYVVVKQACLLELQRKGREPSLNPQEVPFK